MKVEQSGSKGAEEQELNLPMRRIVNAGSVGEPRHGDKATYVIHDDTSGATTIREVEYDVARTCQAIVEAGAAGGVRLAAEPWLRIRRTG